MEKDLDLMKIYNQKAFEWGESHLDKIEDLWRNGWITISQYYELSKGVK